MSEMTLFGEVNVRVFMDDEGEIEIREVHTTYEDEKLELRLEAIAAAFLMKSVAQNSGQGYEKTLELLEIETMNNVGKITKV